MNRHYEIIIYRLFCIILLIMPKDANSQSITGNLKNSEDTIRQETAKHTLFTGLGYGSNFIYLGSTISRNQPYEYSSVIYGYNNALYASVSAVHLSDLSPFLAFYSGSLNYNHVFNSWFDISASFSRYQVTASLEENLFNSFNYGDITLGFDWRILYTKLSGGILFSEEENGYLQIRNSRYFQTPEYTKRKIYFSFDPYIAALFGTMTRLKTTEGQIVKVSPPYKKGGKYGQSQPVTSISRSFELLEADCGLPVSLNSGNLTFEAEPGYIFTGSDDSEYSGTKGFYLTISAYIRIF